MTGEERATDRADRLLAAGAGQSVRLHLLAALLGLALAGGALLAVAAAERRRRAGELRALRVQGLPPRAGATGGLLGYAALVAGGLLAGVPAAAVNWWATRRLAPVFGPDWVATTPPTAPRPLVAALALLAVAVALLACAGYAARRLSREVGAG